MAAAPSIARRYRFIADTGASALPCLYHDDASRRSVLSDVIMGGASDGATGIVDARRSALYWRPLAALFVAAALPVLRAMAR